jgi:hypothetical protein
LLLLKEFDAGSFMTAFIQQQTQGDLSMPAFALDSIHLDWGAVVGIPVIEDFRSRTGADIAVLYLLLPGSSELRAIAAQSAIQTRMKKASSTIGAAMSYWIDSLDGFAEGRVAEDPFFERFPEAMQHRLKHLAIFPLRHFSQPHRELLGLLVIGRCFEGRFGDLETEAAQLGAEHLAAELGQDSLRHHLSERMWIERAKEILHNPRKRFTIFDIAKEAARA